MAGLFPGASSTTEPHAAPQAPAQTPTGAQGFFSTLLSPLYSTPTQPQAGSYEASAPSAINSRRATAASSSSDVAAWFSSGRTPTTADSPATAAPPQPPQPPQSHQQPYGRQLEAPTSLHNGSGQLVPRHSTSRSAPPRGGHASDGGMTSAEAGGPPPLPPVPPAKLGFITQLFGFGDASTASSAPSSASLTKAAVAGASAAGQNPFPGRMPHSKASAPAPSPSTPAPPATDTTATAPAANAASTPSQRGLCSQQMLGYRQCLEVNPDSKTNCTWALDSYMQCQEDAQM